MTIDRDTLQTVVQIVMIGVGLLTPISVAIAGWIVAKTAAENRRQATADAADAKKVAEAHTGTLKQIHDDGNSHLSALTAELAEVRRELNRLGKANATMEAEKQAGLIAAALATAPGAQPLAVEIVGPNPLAVKDVS